MTDNDERMEILEMIEAGVISASEGARLLQALLGKAGEPPDAGSLPAPAPAAEPPTLAAADFPAVRTDEFPAVPAVPVEPQKPTAAQAPVVSASHLPADGAASAAASAEAYKAQPAEAAQASAGQLPAGAPPQLSEDLPPRPASGETSESARPELRRTFDPSLGHWRRWWMIPLWIGVGVTIFGAVLLFVTLQATGTSFWFGCAWLPFLLGVAVMALAWSSRRAHWLHLRVHQKPGERPQTIAISFPIPLHLAAWFVRLFRGRIPQLNQTGLDEMILALGHHTSPEAPFYVEVDEGEDGEKVQIYIG